LAGRVTSLQGAAGALRAAGCAYAAARAPTADVRASLAVDPSASHAPLGREIAALHAAFGARPGARSLIAYEGTGSSAVAPRSFHATKLRLGAVALRGSRRTDSGARIGAAHIRTGSHVLPLRLPAADLKRVSVATRIAGRAGTRADVVHAHEGAGHALTPGAVGLAPVLGHSIAPRHSRCADTGTRSLHAEIRAKRFRLPNARAVAAEKLTFPALLLSGRAVDYRSRIVGVGRTCTVVRNGAVAGIGAVHSRK
jgi:hypothetical protein